jgi:hypothetical protein
MGAHPERRPGRVVAQALHQSIGAGQTQIELAFKRLKGQIRLATLRAKDPRLARACLLAKLILGLLVERLVAPARRPFRLAPAPARRPCGG